VASEDDRSVTELLRAWRAGEREALDRLVPLVYRELRRMAQREMNRERPGQTLEATGLVHEVFVRLVDVDVSWQDRAHFLAVAARMMRRILISRSRDKARAKRGGGRPILSLDELARAGVDPASPRRSPDVLELDRALRELEEVDPLKAQVTELVYFGGLTYDEAAEALAISRATAHRHLRFAKAWLHARLASPTVWP
jgi:RNA polymerase sigma factor (TIGR02999 family)